MVLSGAEEMGETGGCDEVETRISVVKTRLLYENLKRVMLALR
jgi:hypothetical protein